MVTGFIFIIRPYLVTCDELLNLIDHMAKEKQRFESSTTEETGEIDLF